jgi:hypothetical protein
MPNTHTTLLEILTRPVTGDISEIKDITGKITSNSPSKEITKENIPNQDDEKVSQDDYKAGEKIYHEALAYIKDAIAPAMVKVTPRDIQINDTFCKTLFTYAYPDFLE